jgi:hypothetical protein
MNTLKLDNRREALLEDLNFLKDKAGLDSKLIARHNTILAIKLFGKVSHIVDTSVEKNLRPLCTISKHLEAPCYTPQDAQAWLKEDTKFSVDVEVEKVLLSRAELRELIIQEREVDLNIVEAQIRLMGVQS